MNDTMSEIEIAYDGAYNVVVECTQCGTGRGSSVVAETKLGPSWEALEHCEECSSHTYHDPVREAERGEYDGHLICDDCDEMFTNTMDVDLHDCPCDGHDDESDDGDETEIVTDGGEDKSEHVDDETVQTAIKQNDQPGHSEALTVDEVRDLLAHIQTGVEVAWDTYMDHVEDGNAEVVHESRDLVILSTGDHDWVSEELDHYDGDVQVDKTAKTVVSQVHHMVAKEHCDYDWSYSHPFVMVKPDSYDAGERFVTAVVNGLQARGLSPGQAWAYYGVEIKDNSMNNWGVRKGDHDHKNVSDALKTAKKKLPEAF